MNLRAMVIVVFLVLVSGGLMVHFRQQSIKPPEEELVKDEEVAPKPAAHGPYGKFVVIGKTAHNFGVMEHGKKGSHEFKIRNDGEAPLKLVALKRDHTCQCTLGSLGTSGLKPGEETTVTLSWEIKNPSTRFEHSAKIRTDDPDRPVTTFRVLGMVGKRLAVKTGLDVNIGRLSEKEPTQRVFVLHSEIVDDFEITKVETSSPLLEVTTRPLKGEELQEAARDPTNEEAVGKKLMDEKMAEMEKTGRAKEEGGHGDDHDPENDLAGKSPPVKSGHEIKVVLQQGFPIGKFRETVTLHTNIPDTPPISVTFQGSRVGPIELLGTPGTGWSPDESLLRIGRFRAQDGKKVRLLVFSKKFDATLEITEAHLSPSFLKYELVKDENFKQPARERFDLWIEVPAGQAPVSFTGESGGSIVLHTNHPEAKVIRLGIEFVSY
ncbi:MAG: hypothetical protein FD138_3877 [Planctomycetota bacterium]|nr:MAG: hypothetical protein FD138_3877 [Planctomycetota bacterium]